MFRTLGILLVLTAPGIAQQQQHVTRLVLDAVPFEEAARRIADATGISITLDGQAQTRVSLELHDTGFWDALLELCRRGGADLLPDRGSGIRLQPGVELADGYYPHGPLLLRLSARELERQRAGMLAVSVRAMPGYAIVGRAPLRFANGKDFEG